MPSPFDSEKETTIQHGLWAGRACLLPMQRAFRSTLCISAAVLLITASAGSAALPPELILIPIDITTSLSNSTDISVGSSAAPVDESVYSRIYGMQITGSPSVDTTFINTGNISLFYNFDEGGGHCMQ